MVRKIYIICPVRNCTEEEQKQLEAYVEKLEEQNCVVHFPPRDVDQTLEGKDICIKHRERMWDANEVHIWWNPDSKGSYVDFGMAYMRRYDKPHMKFVLINDFQPAVRKSYGTVIKQLCEEDKLHE